MSKPAYDWSCSTCFPYKRIDETRSKNVKRNVKRNAAHLQSPADAPYSAILLSSTTCSGYVYTFP
jgi:hypothetical protein